MLRKPCLPECGIKCVLESVIVEYVIVALFGRISFSSVMTVTEAITYTACDPPCRSRLRVSGPVTSACNSSMPSEAAGDGGIAV